MRRLRSLVVTSVLVALAVSACSSGGDSHPAAHRIPPIGYPIQDHDGEDPVAKGPYVVKGATSGGVVTVLTHDGLRGTLDPTGVARPDLLSIDRGLLTRSLTQYGYNPRTEQMTLIPDLATDLGSHNDRYTKWLFRVRGGTRFEDGEKVTAASVVRGIRACVRAARHGSGPCVGQPFRSVRVREHSDVVIRTVRPFPDLPYLATFPALGPLPARAAPRPLATGPYRVARYEPGHRLVLTRNPQWDPASDPVRTAYPDRYVVRAGVPAGAIARTLLADTGAAQTTLTYDGLSPAAYARLRAADRRRLVLGGRPCATYVVPDDRTVRGVLVRTALSWAYPYRRLIGAGGGIPGVTVVPATELTPPGVPGRTARPVTRRQGFDHDPARSRALLRRAGVLGFPIRLPAGADPAVTAALRAGGFTPLPGRSPADLRVVTRCSSSPTATSWIAPMSRPELNPAHFSAPPRLRHRIAQVARLPLEHQPAAWNALDHTILAGWLPLVPATCAGVDMAHGSRIHGMADDTTLGMPTWQQLWVSP